MTEDKSAFDLNPIQTWPPGGPHKNGSASGRAVSPLFRGAPKGNRTPNFLVRGETFVLFGGRPEQALHSIFGELASVVYAFLRSPA